jgi:Lar family restriction alleviation protein
MSEELKPCPFCGGDAQVTYFWQSYSHMIVCEDCGNKTPPQHTKDEAVAAWNRRASDTLLDAIHVAVNEAIGGKVALSEIPKVIRERMR